MSEQYAAALWERIAGFEFDDGDTQLTFHRRLARENGWTPPYTSRVIREYRRFAYLAVAAGHPVAPSEDVDQVWHLHLTYTRSYWNRFCRDVLGRPLHHEPTRGGRAEASRHSAMYEQTLASYAAHFGEPPPPDIWPPTELRFAAAGRSRWSDASKHYVIRRSVVLAFGLMLLLSASTAILEGCAVVADANPFDMAGPEFLALYGGIIIAGAVGGIMIRRMLGNPADEQALILNDPYAVACLAHGPRGIGIAALTSLVHRGCIEVEHRPKKLFGSATPGRLVNGPSPPVEAPEIEHAIYKAVADRPLQGEGLQTSEIFKAVQSATEKYQRELRAAGLMQPSDLEPSPRRYLPVAVMGAVVLIGLIKVCVGFSRGKPVSHLVMLMVVAGVAGLAFAWQRRVSAAGQRVLKRLQAEHKPLESFDTIESPADHRNLLLTVGLFGLASLAAAPHFDPLCQSLKQDRFLTNTGDIASNTGGGGCGSGCGGGGGGGCGGGGCGGCGGD